MAIIDDASYPAQANSNIQKSFFPEFTPSSKNQLGYQKRTRAQGTTIRKMFGRENNGIRPRRINNGSWTNNSVFKIGEFYNTTWEEKVTPDFYKHSQTNLKPHEKKTTVTFRRKVMQRVESYCSTSSLHGLRYIGDPELSMGERTFWFIAFAAAIGFSAYYIQNIYHKWNLSPVIISFSPFDAGFEEIPFPAITICNMNQAKRSEAERINREGSPMEKRLLSDYCTLNNSFVDTSEEAPDWSEVQNFMVKVGQSCTDTLKYCSWQNIRVNCDDFFNNDLTDEGLCCSFNRLPPEKIFKNPNDLAILNQTYTEEVYDWTPEKGYADKLTADKNPIPRRPAGSGTHLGLTIIIDAQLDNYYCSSTDSVGFKLIVANPIETPKMADFGFLISPGVEARYIVKPQIRQATDALRDIDIEKRQCFFSSERTLRYYKTYTKRNCNLECQSNYTRAKCDCIPYYLPQNKKTRTCGKRDEQCSNKAKDEMELTYGNGSSCNCLPGCFEINYEKSGSYSELSEKFAVTRDLDLTPKYFKENMAILHFFFRDSKFRKQIKSELYGFTEVLSNIGGLLGLCMGFSFLSLIELLYYITIKVLCENIRARIQRKKKELNVKHPNSIPFTK